MSIEVPNGERGGLANPQAPGTTKPPRKIRAGLVNGRSVKLWNRAPAIRHLGPVYGVPVRLPSGDLGGVPKPKVYPFESLLSKYPIPKNTTAEQLRIVRERVLAANRTAIYANYQSHPILTPGPSPLDWAVAPRVKPNRRDAVVGVLTDLAPRTTVRDTTLGRDTTPYSVWRGIIGEVSTDAFRAAPIAPVGAEPAVFKVTQAQAQAIQADVATKATSAAEPGTASRDKAEKALYLVAAVAVLFLVVRGRA